MDTWRLTSVSQYNNSCEDYVNFMQRIPDGQIFYIMNFLWEISEKLTQMYIIIDYL